MGRALWLVVVVMVVVEVERLACTTVSVNMRSTLFPSPATPPSETHEGRSGVEAER